jgi:hypothetical protein
MPPAQLDRMVGSGSTNSSARLPGQALNDRSIYVVTEQRNQVNGSQQLHPAKSRASHVLVGSSVCSAVVGPHSKELL